MANDALSLGLETYLHEISETPLLSPEEEKQLAYRIEQGDSEARERMVQANLRLVVNIARDYTGKGLDLDDLIAEGSFGLLCAVEGFDPAMNTRFSTYASYWIKQSIRRALTNTAKTIRIPAYMVELLAKWRRAKSQLQRELGRTPTETEIAKSLALPKRKLKYLMMALRANAFTPPAESSEPDEQFEEIAGSNAKPPRTAGEKRRKSPNEILDDNSKPPDTTIAEAEDINRMFELLDKMDDRTAAVLRMRFGLDDWDEKTLEEVGELFGLTRERIRQIESQALCRLREDMDTEG